jgi:hypothetical protein
VRLVCCSGSINPDDDVDTDMAEADCKDEVFSESVERVLSGSEVDAENNIGNLLI